MRMVAFERGGGHRPRLGYVNDCQSCLLGIRLCYNNGYGKM